MKKIVFLIILLYFLSGNKIFASGIFRHCYCDVCTPIYIFNFNLPYLLNEKIFLLFYLSIASFIFLLNKYFSLKKLNIIYKLILYFLSYIVFFVFLIHYKKYDISIFFIVLTILTIIKFLLVKLFKKINYFNITNLNYYKLIKIYFFTSIVFPILFYLISNNLLHKINIFSIIIYCVFIFLLETFLFDRLLKIKFKTSLIIWWIINLIFIFLFILIVSIFKYFLN